MHLFIFARKHDQLKGTMWIQVRSFDGKKSLRVDNLSKLTKIEEVRSRLVEEFEAPVEKQRLFYRGKQVLAFCQNDNFIIIS